MLWFRDSTSRPGQTVTVVTERAEKIQWVLRMILWFVTSYTIIIIVHERAHAVVAYAFGLNPTLFQFWVNFDFDRATLSQRALV